MWLCRSESQILSPRTQGHVRNPWAGQLRGVVFFLTFFVPSSRQISWQRLRDPEYPVPLNLGGVIPGEAAQNSIRSASFDEGDKSWVTLITKYLHLRAETAGLHECDLNISCPSRTRSSSSSSVDSATGPMAVNSFALSDCFWCCCWSFFFWRHKSESNESAISAWKRVISFLGADPRSYNARSRWETALFHNQSRITNPQLLWRWNTSSHNVQRTVLWQNLIIPTAENNLSAGLLQCSPERCLFP